MADEAGQEEEEGAAAADVPFATSPDDSVSLLPLARDLSQGTVGKEDRRKERIRAHHDRKKGKEETVAASFQSVPRASSMDDVMMEGAAAEEPQLKPLSKACSMDELTGSSHWGSSVHKARSEMSMSESINADPLDFVLCMGNFSMRDEDIFKNLIQEDFEYSAYLPKGKQCCTIKVGHAVSMAQYSVSSNAEVEPLLASLASITAAKDDAADIDASDIEFEPVSEPLSCPNALVAFEKIKERCVGKQVGSRMVCSAGYSAACSRSLSSWIMTARSLP